MLDFLKHMQLFFLKIETLPIIHSLSVTYTYINYFCFKQRGLWSELFDCIW